MSGRRLAAAGLSKDAITRRVQAGRLHRLYRGVYAVGHEALTVHGRMLAAVLACGPGAVLSHRAAGWLWEITRSAATPEVTSPRHRAPGRDFIVHCSPLHDEDRWVLESIPVTSLARTLVDLADVLTDRRLADAVHESEVRRLFDLGAVERVLVRTGGRRGHPRLLRVLADYRPDDHVTESNAEDLFVEICQRFCLPEPRKQVPLGEYRVDFYWPEARLAVEVDGGAVHATRQAFQADRERDRNLAAMGIQVARVTQRDLAEPAALALQLKAILAARL